MDGLKYKYPEDISNSLMRKKFRQQIRGKLKTLENNVYKVKETYGKDSDEYSDARKKLKKFKKKYIADD